MQFRLLSVAALALCAPSVAEAAKEPSIWVKCDGYAKPEPGGVKLAKGLAALSTLGIFGIPESFHPHNRAQGGAGVTACKTALAAPELEAENWLRRVRLNQALAIHYLEGDNPDGALTALDAAVSAAGDNASHPMYARSTGVSLDLLRSYVLLRLGRAEESDGVARRASAARPYSARVQMMALGMMALDGKGDDLGSVADRVHALDPARADDLAFYYLRDRRYNRAWALLSAARAVKPKEGGQAGLFNARRTNEAMVAAFVAARVGQRDDAERIIAEERAAIAATVEMLAKMKLRLADPGAQATSPDAPAADAKPQTDSDLLSAPIERWGPLIAAAGKLAADDHRAAQTALIAGTSFPMNVMLTDLVADIRTAVPAAERKGIVAIDPADLRAKLNAAQEDKIGQIKGKDLFEMLPEPEDEKQLNSYSKQAGWGLKPTGFRHKAQDDGTPHIEFVGSSSSPLAVEEMTLLRAADLALQAGKAGFTIEKRNDYSRMRQMTYGGTPIGQASLAGYMTTVDVRFTDDAGAARFQDAATIRAALAPIYIRPKS